MIDAAARSGTMIEINADPHRLDLDWIHARKAAARGIPIVINPDAHSTRGLLNLDYGVGVARKAGLTAAQVFNAGAPAEVGAAWRPGRSELVDSATRERCRTCG